MSKFSRIAKNAALGDGCVRITHQNAHMSFMSTDLNILKFKKSMCDREGISSAEFGTQKSGYGGTKTIHNFRTRVNPLITDVAQATTTELIKSIDKEDLFLWYLDDGSWHKNQRLMHLYCNMLDDDELEVLIERIYQMYGIAPSPRKDRKKDGRSFNYLYFPRKLTVLVRPELKEWIQHNNLDSFLYKVGGEDYEDPIEAISAKAKLEAYDLFIRTYASIRRIDKQPIITDSGHDITLEWKSPKEGVKTRVYNYANKIEKDAM